MRKVLASRKMLCEKCLRAQRKQKKRGKFSNKPKEKKMILSGVQRIHVSNVCDERLDKASSLYVSLSIFTRLLRIDVMISFCKFSILLLIVTL